MAFSVGNGKRGPQAEINVTPLIDVVLVLLIIFMVMTPVMLKELVAKVPQKQTENVPLPPARPPSSSSWTRTTSCRSTARAIAPEALGGKVGDRLAHDRQKVVFFKIADDANYGRAVRIMDICKGAGAKTLGIVTKDDRFDSVNFASRLSTPAPNRLDPCKAPSSPASPSSPADPRSTGCGSRNYESRRIHRQSYH